MIGKLMLAKGVNQSETFFDRKTNKSSLVKNTVRKQSILQDINESELCIKKQINKFKNLKKQENIQNRQQLKRRVRQISVGKNYNIQTLTENQKKLKTNFKSLGIQKVVIQMKKMIRQITHIITLLKNLMEGVFTDTGKVFRQLQKKTNQYMTNTLQKMSQIISGGGYDNTTTINSGTIENKKLTQSFPAVKKQLRTAMTLKQQIKDPIDQEDGVISQILKDKTYSSIDRQKQFNGINIYDKINLKNQNQQSFLKKNSEIDKQQKLTEQLQGIDQMLKRLKLIIS